MLTVVDRVEEVPAIGLLLQAGITLEVGTVVHDGRDEGGGWGWEGEERRTGGAVRAWERPYLVVCDGGDHVEVLKFGLYAELRHLLRLSDLRSQSLAGQWRALPLALPLLSRPAFRSQK